MRVRQRVDADAATEVLGVRPAVLPDFAQFEHAEGGAQIFLRQDNEHPVAGTDAAHESRDPVANFQRVLVADDADAPCLGGGAKPVDDLFPLAPLGREIVAPGVGNEILRRRDRHRARRDGEFIRWLRRFLPDHPFRLGAHGFQSVASGTLLDPSSQPF